MLFGDSGMIRKSNHPKHTGFYLAGKAPAAAMRPQDGKAV